MLTNFLIIFAGLVIILLLSEIVIRNAIEIAEHFHLSGTFIGMTVLSFGTSIPEIMSNIVGGVNILHQPENMNTISALMIGTIIGSDIFQQTFILAFVGLVGTVIVHRKNLVSEIGSMVGAAVLLWIFCLDGEISRPEGLILLISYFGYLLYLGKKNHLVDQIAADRNNGKRKVILSIIIIIICFVVMTFVTDQVVNGAIKLVHLLPISASYFGVIILGIATALPELTTSMVSIWKGQKGISAGILIGSNVTNPLLAIGLGAIISSYKIPDVIIYYDMPVNIAITFVLFIFLWRHEDLTKKEALSLIIIYIAYFYSRDLFFPHDFPINGSI